jgi:PEGA domain-containing protein
MGFSVQRCCWQRRTVQPISGHWGFTLFAALLCLCALARSARAQEPPKGLSEDQVVKLLKEDPPARVQYLVNKYGVAFSLTPDAEKDLTRAGATPELLDLVRKLAPKPAEVKAPPPPPPASPPVLVINAKPGQAEVYVDDERRGQTSAAGTLKVSGLAQGSHLVRLTLAGYQSFEINVELTAGETNTIAAKLLPVEAPPPPKQEPTTGAGATPAPIVKAPSDPNNPLTPHEPGIYSLEEKGNTHLLVPLEQAPAAGRSASMGRGGMFGAGFGGGVKWKSMIYGSKARIRLPSGRLVFYFYFPPPDASASGYSETAFRPSSTPNGFILVHLESKKNERQIPAKGSVTATVEAKDLVPFDYEKLAAGIYKVQLKNDLGPGEYGFLFGGVLQAMGDVSLFDFGIDNAKKQ